MAMGMPYGLQAMLKEGHKHFSGVEEAVMKNIDACKALAQMTRTSLGPNGKSRAVQSLACGIPAMLLQFKLMLAAHKHIDHPTCVHLVGCCCRDEQDGHQSFRKALCNQ
jgi:hypothetical protein